MRNLFFVLTIFLFTFGSSLQADKISPDWGSTCDTNFDSANPPVVTFLGDSLGDFVDMPEYGWADWRTYLGFSTAFAQ
jgi:hypothetical protein